MHASMKTSSRVYIVTHGVGVRLFPPPRRGGGVPRDEAGGAWHQGHGGVLREAAAAAEGRQPRVEQPGGLHVAGQPGGKSLFTHAR